MYFIKNWKGGVRDTQYEEMMRVSRDESASALTDHYTMYTRPELSHCIPSICTTIICQLEPI